MTVLCRILIENAIAHQTVNKEQVLERTQFVSLVVSLHLLPKFPLKSTPYITMRIYKTIQI